MAQLNFDATTVAPNEGIEALPAGWYNVAIDETEMKPTKDGLGTYLQVRFNVLDGASVGRKVFTRLNLRNNNPVAQEIAYKDLSAIAHAVGVLQVQDSSQLHGIPLKIKVSMRPASSEYDASNDVKSYKNINEQVGGAASAPGAAPSGPPAGFAPQGFAPQQAPQQAPAGFAPQQAQQAPQGFAQQAPVQQPAQQQAPAQQPQQPQWQAPAAQQPWQDQNQAPQQAPQQFAQQPQQAAQPQQQAPAEQQAPQQHQAQPQTSAPAWAGNQNPQQAAPPWAPQQ